MNYFETLVDVWWMSFCGRIIGKVRLVKVPYQPQLASEVGSNLIRSPIFKDALQLSFYAIFCGRPPSSSNSPKLFVIAGIFQSSLLTSIGLGGRI